VIEGIVARVWPAGVDAIEPLGGGITNHNFKVVAGGESFVLRIGGKDTELLGIDREIEHAATVNAAHLGLGPEVVAFVEPEGYLVTRFLEGETGKVGAVEAASLLRRLHEGPPIPGAFDAFRVVEAYAATAAARGRGPTAGYTAAKAIAGRIERRRGKHPLVPCHNDLLPANFVGGAGRTWIVDWEYAGMGDAAFDVANFAANSELDEAGDAALLEAYGGGDPDVHVLMRFMSDFREAMWGVVQEAVAELEFDFGGYADRHFGRLERAADEHRFARALG